MAFYTNLPIGDTTQYEIDVHHNDYGFIIIKIGESGYLSLSILEANDISSKLRELMKSDFKFLSEAE